MPDIHMGRTDRVPARVTIAATNADGSPGTVTGLDVAVVPLGCSPDAATKWTATTFASGTGTFTLAGPDADHTGAVAVPASGAALYVRDTAADHTQDPSFMEASMAGGAMTRDWLIDAGERALRAFAAALLATLGVGDGLDAFHVNWLDALSVGLGAAIISVLTSLAALKLGGPGTAGLTDATVSASYADSVARGRHEAGLRAGPP